MIPRGVHPQTAMAQPLTLTGRPCPPLPTAGIFPQFFIVALTLLTTFLAYLPIPFCCDLSLHRHIRPFTTKGALSPRDRALLTPSMRPPSRRFGGVLRRLCKRSKVIRQGHRHLPKMWSHTPNNFSVVALVGCSTDKVPCV